MALRCRRCHRVLKCIECQEVGYGKVCFWKAFGKPFPKTKKERSKAKQLTEMPDETPPLFKDEYFEGR